MRQQRWSFSVVMTLIAILAVDLLAYVNAGELWASLIFSISFFSLIVATIGAKYGEDPLKTFWGGFAITGWIYLLFSLGPGAELGTRTLLFSTKVMDLISFWAIGDIGVNRFSVRPTSSMTTGYLQVTAHSQAAFFLALAGGELACYFARNRWDRAEAGPAQGAGQPLETTNRVAFADNGLRESTAR